MVAENVVENENRGAEAAAPDPRDRNSVSPQDQAATLERNRAKARDSLKVGTK